MKMFDQMELYKKLSKVIVELFDSKELFGKERLELQNTLTKSITEILIIALDYNYKEEDLIELNHHMNKADGNKMILFTQYLENTLENEASYTILNKFLLDTVLNTIKNLSKEKLPIAEQILDKNNVSFDTMKKIQEKWEVFTREKLV